MMHYLLKYYYENNTNFDHIGGKQESKIRVDSVWHLKQDGIRMLFEGIKFDL